MKTKFMFISAIFALIMSALWAADPIAFSMQETPESPQSRATVGLTGTDADSFMSTLDWAGVSFDKLFTYVAYKQGEKNTIDLGAAFKAGPVYIGSWYKGNLGAFTANGTGNYEKVTTTVVPAKETGHHTVVGNTKRDKKAKWNREYSADHTVGVLIGFGSMGVQVGYKREGAADANKTGTYYGGALKENHTETNSNIGGLSTIMDEVYDPKGFVKSAKQTPFVAFGMNIPVGAMTVSPQAELEVKIDQTSSYGKKTATQKNAGTNRTETISALGRSDANVGITGKLGAGLALGDSLNSFFKIGYAFTVNAYSKTYKDLDGKAHKVAGTYNVTEDSIERVYNWNNSGTEVITKKFKGTFTKTSFFSNTLQLEYAMQKDLSERLSLFAGVECPILVSVEKQVEKTEETESVRTIQLKKEDGYKSTTTEKTVTHPEVTTNTTRVVVEPKAKAALTYAALPNRVLLSLGTDVAFLKGSFTYTKKSVDRFVSKTDKVTTQDDGAISTTDTETSYAQEPQEESVTKDSKQEQVSVKLKGGLKWNIAENVAFDFGYEKSLLDSFSFTNIGDMSIACTIKF